MKLNHYCGTRRLPTRLRSARECKSFLTIDEARLALLELDHVEPWAKLGDTGVGNVRLRCQIC